MSGIVLGAFFGFVAMGIGKPSFDAAAQAYLAERSEYRQRARVLGIVELAWAGGFLIGAPVAGWLIDRHGWTAPFWALTILLVGALLLVPRMLEPDNETALASRARVSWSQSGVALLIVFVMFTFASELLFVALGNWLETDYDLSLLALGGVGAVIGFAELGGETATVVMTDRIGKRRAVAIGMVVAAVGFGVIAVSDVQAVALVAVVIAFLGFEFTIVSALPFASEMSRMGRAQYLAWIQAAMAIARAVGAAVGNPLFEAAGIAGNGWAAAALNVAALVVLVRFVVEPNGDE